MAVLQQLLFKTIGFGLNIIGLFSAKTGGRLAYRVFTTAPSPQLRPKDVEFLSTATRKDVLRAGREVVEYHWGM